MERLSIILPAYNERGNIAPLLEEIAAVVANLPCPTEVIIVDDGSTDGTFVEAEQTAPTLSPPLDAVVLVRLNRNYGQTVATAAGILHATGDVIVIMDADRQNDPADIPRLLAKLQEGFDVVSGWRKERKDKWTRVLPSKVANALISWVTGVKVHDLGCSLRAYKAWVLQTLVREGLNHRYMPIYCASKGAQIAEIVVNHRPRLVGQSKYGLWRIFIVLRDLPLLAFLARYGQNPYAAMATVAFKMLLLGLVCELASWWTKSSVPLWLFLLLATQAGLLGLGLLAELIVRQSGQRLEAIRQSIAEVKTFRAQVETDVR
ncbi:glycosyltransferase family 2 protein [Fervidibacter sacchari]